MGASGALNIFEIRSTLRLSRVAGRLNSPPQNCSPHKLPAGDGIGNATFVPSTGTRVPLSGRMSASGFFASRKHDRSR